jgi:NAD(P)-dependent dehydrogenase (short-subunit alcohol dehydrogenase family)
MMAKSLDANGAAKVYIIGRRFEKLEEVASQAINKSIIPIKGDLSVKESLAECAARVASETPFVNVVIANSGAQGPTVNELPKDRTLSLAEFHEYLWKPTYSEFNEAFEINSTAMFYTMVAFLPLLDAGNNHKSSPTFETSVKSQFIITGSISSLSRRPGMGFAYSASKAAAGLMMRQISTMLVPYHIRANIINPGIYPSDMSAVSPFWRVIYGCTKSHHRHSWMARMAHSSARLIRA